MVLENCCQVTTFSFAESLSNSTRCVSCLIRTHSKQGRFRVWSLASFLGTLIPCYCYCCGNGATPGPSPIEGWLPAFVEVASAWTNCIPASLSSEASSGVYHDHRRFSMDRSHQKYLPITSQDIYFGYYG